MQCSARTEYISLNQTKVSDYFAPYKGRPGIPTSCPKHPLQKYLKFKWRRKSRTPFSINHQKREQSSRYKQKRKSRFFTLDSALVRSKQHWFEIEHIEDLDKTLAPLCCWYLPHVRVTLCGAQYSPLHFCGAWWILIQRMGHTTNFAQCDHFVWFTYICHAGWDRLRRRRHRWD